MVIFCYVFPTGTFEASDALYGTARGAFLCLTVQAALKGRGFKVFGELWRGNLSGSYLVAFYRQAVVSEKDDVRTFISVVEKHTGL